MDIVVKPDYLVKHLWRIFICVVGSYLHDLTVLAGATNPGVGG